MGQMVGFFFEREEFLVFESAIAKDRQSFHAKKTLGAIVLRCGLERAMESRRASFWDLTQGMECESLIVDLQLR